MVRAEASLQGLSVGDAFGEALYGEDGSERVLPSGEWSYTDDTAMSISIVWCLRAFDGIDQDALAASFAREYSPGRGYGNAMHDLLKAVNAGGAWRSLAPAVYGGKGSCGNGAAMRVAPLGAYFADAVEQIPQQATFSAEVTHSHPEGIAGAIAVALAAAFAFRTAGSKPPISDLVNQFIDMVPNGLVRDGLVRACEIPDNTPLAEVAATLGNGKNSLCQDTVPFCVWLAFLNLDAYEEALWKTVSAGGDLDTNCAIVGGIIGARLGPKGIPQVWLRRREPLPDWYKSRSV